LSSSDFLLDEADGYAIVLAGAASGTGGVAYLTGEAASGAG